MGSPEFGADAPCQIADASVWINLVATSRCADIVSALDGPIAIVDVAMRELERGSANGHGAFAHILPLIRASLVRIVKLEPEDENLYLSLVAGGTAETLDDGEAATLVAAVRLRAIALIDERKATRIARCRFPRLAVRSTTDLLFDTLPDAGDTVGPLADALFAALQGARMRVPSHWHARVASVLGPERTRLCHSLPAHIRLPHAEAARGAHLRE
jgi:predicted nucleic acid-binding protein